MSAVAVQIRYLSFVYIFFILGDFEDVSLLHTEPRTLILTVICPRLSEPRRCTPDMGASIGDLREDH